MQTPRIFFPDNPWPEGHPIKAFRWTAEVRDGVVWFNLHLETEDYYCERDIEETDEDSDNEDYTDWNSPSVWGNYHSCTISSTEWHDGGFPVCPVDEFDVDALDGYMAEVDPLPIDLTADDFDWDDLAFQTYLLGHDSVGSHNIKFSKNSAGSFDIEWTGRIALAYAGEYDYDYSFHTKIEGVQAPTIAE